MKKIIFAAAILSAAVMTGCSLSFDGTDSSQPAENVQGSENAVTTQGTDTESLAVRATFSGAEEKDMRLF